MIYKIENRSMQVVAEIEPDGANAYISVLKPDEAQAALSGLAPEKEMDRFFENVSMRFEGHEDFDLLCIPFFEFSRQLKESPNVFIFIQKNRLYFVCETCENLTGLLEQFGRNYKNQISMGKVINAFFEYLLENDLSELDGIEQRISDLEDSVLTDKQGNFTKEIISHRKRLTVIMRYYEELLDILEYVSMNAKHVFSSRSARYLAILHGKTDRLYDKVKGLREYVSEIREAYQAEVDIRLNNIMKILTIVTIIFMPLTLIVGWYGMNLQMPEYGSAAAYPLVIVISVLIIVLSVLFFKRQKWF